MSKVESKVYFDDCKQFLPAYENNEFDIAIVDPNYGINAPKMSMGHKPKNTSTAVKLRKGRLNNGAGKLKNRALNTMDCSWDEEVPDQDYFDQLFRVSKHQIIWGGNYFNLPPTRCIICWDKCQPWDNFSQWEMAWTSFDMPAKMYRISNTGGNNKEEKIHPTQKPVALYDCLYRDFVLNKKVFDKTPFKIKVLDTHLGSGSNRISAHKAGVNFVSMEKVKQYYDSQEKRFKIHSMSHKLNF